jgi:hypothetical protein
MEYFLCEFEYNYVGKFYQVVDNGNVIDYVDYTLLGLKK